jgi:hypothetical protein
MCSVSDIERIHIGREVAVKKCDNTDQASVQAYLAEISVMKYVRACAYIHIFVLLRLHSVLVPVAAVVTRTRQIRLHENIVRLIGGTAQT